MTGGGQRGLLMIIMAPPEVSWASVRYPSSVLSRGSFTVFKGLTRGFQQKYLVRPSRYSRLSVVMTISLGLAGKAFDFHMSGSFVQSSPVSLLMSLFNINQF